MASENSGVGVETQQIVQRAALAVFGHPGIGRQRAVGLYRMRRELARRRLVRRAEMRAADRLRRGLSAARPFGRVAHGIGRVHRGHHRPILRHRRLIGARQCGRDLHDRLSVPVMRTLIIDGRCFFVPPPPMVDRAGGEHNVTFLILLCDFSLLNPEASASSGRQGDAGGCGRRSVRRPRCS